MVRDHTHVGKRSAAFLLKSLFVSAYIDVGKTRSVQAVALCERG